jgi:uncharacterized protein
LVFRRRRPVGRLRRLRGLLWPEIGWRRAAHYLIARIKRLPGTPHGIAAGFASGAAASCTPLMGFHFLLSFAIAFLVRGNYLAAALGTAVGNPWTFPFIFAWIYHLGRAILGDSSAATMRTSEIAEGGLLEQLGEMIVPMMVGAVPTGIVVWILVYLPVRRLVAAFHNARRRRHEQRRRELALVPVQDRPAE